MPEHDTSPTPASPTGASAGARGEPTAARWAMAAIFFVNGMIMASYFVRVPSLKVEHGLTEGQLGLLLIVMPVSALLSMQLAGNLTARVGSAWIARVTAVGLSLSMFGIGAADSVVYLVLALVVFGLIDGLLDVSMNAQAVAVERAAKRPIMNSCHAAWSIGAVIGSSFGGLAMRLEWSIAQHYLLAGAFLALVAAVAGRWTLPAGADRAPEQADKGSERVGWRTGWTGRVVLLGAMGATVLLCEGAIGNWSGVFLHEDHGAPLAVASTGYIGFTVLQVAGRLVGDRLHERYGAPALVRWSSAIAILGMALVVFGPSPVPVIAGFTVVGAGVSVLLPVVFSAVGHSGASDSGTHNAAVALSRFTTMTYSGLLMGPAVIGWLAEWIGLTWTLGCLLVLMVGVMLNAGATATANRESEKESPAA